MTTTAPRRTRRFLAPLATLAVAGALVIGSGADFTSTSGNTQSVVASGSMDQLNSRNGAAVFNVSNIKPGDSVTGSVKITNVGTLQQKFTATETATNAFSGALTMSVTEIKTDGTRTPVYNGAFAGFGTKQLTTFSVNESRTYEFVVTLAQSATNTDQGKTATASYAWAGNQVTTPADIDQREAANLTAPTPAYN